MPSLTLQPDATDGVDVFIYLNAPTNNYGINAGLYTGGNPNDIPRSFIRFDVSSIPAGSTVSLATMTLNCVSAFVGTDNTLVSRCLTQWFEGAKNGAAPDAGQDGSTWNLRNANGSVAWAGGAGGAAGSDWSATPTASVPIALNATGFYDFILTSDVALFVGGTSNLGWAITQQTEVAYRRQFDSSDHGTASWRPKLVVEYSIPVAATGNAPFARTFHNVFRGPMG